ncbi:unnamed protein product [Sphagnum tenellum]
MIQASEGASAVRAIEGASAACTKQRAKARESSSSHEAHSPSSLRHRVPGPACCRRPDDGSGDGPSRRESKAVLKLRPHRQSSRSGCAEPLL